MASKQGRRSNSANKTFHKKENKSKATNKPGIDTVEAEKDITDTPSGAKKRGTIKGKGRKEVSDEKEEGNSFSEEEEPDVSVEKHREMAMKQIVCACFVDVGNGFSMLEQIEEMKIISNENNKTELTTTFEEGMT